MRISDWSSDVCSSDLCQPALRHDALALAEQVGQHPDEAYRQRGGTVGHQEVNFAVARAAGHRAGLDQAADPHLPVRRDLLLRQVRRAEEEHHAVLEGGQDQRRGDAEKGEAAENHRQPAVLARTVGLAAHSLSSPPATAAPPPARRRGSTPAVRSRSTSASPCRSEEHTSELQSLMRNSYAVFCLKKKKP